MELSKAEALRAPRNARILPARKSRVACYMFSSIKGIWSSEACVRSGRPSALIAKASSRPCMNNNN